MAAVKYGLKRYCIVLVLRTGHRWSRYAVLLFSLGKHQTTAELNRWDFNFSQVNTFPDASGVLEKPCRKMGIFSSHLNPPKKQQ